jgi:hypothetical protein
VRCAAFCLGGKSVIKTEIFQKEVVGCRSLGSCWLSVSVIRTRIGAGKLEYFLARRTEESSVVSVSGQWGTALVEAGKLEYHPCKCVPEGQCDRSLARSAWDSATPKKPSRRARYDRAQLIPEVFFVETCAAVS